MHIERSHMREMFNEIPEKNRLFFLKKIRIY